LGREVDVGAGDLERAKVLQVAGDLAAGVVGETLTEFFVMHVPELASREQEMMALGRSFGQGLQMTNILKAMDAGADEFIIKPFTPEVMLEKIHSTVNS